MDTTLVIDNISQRGEAYTALLQAVKSRGQAALHGTERYLLFEAADAMLFGETEASQKTIAAEAMLENLASSDRWTRSSVQEISRLLSAIA